MAFAIFGNYRKMADSEKRNEILKAASYSFARFGFSKTTMDDIGKLVGLNKASLYYYYKNKEAIFCEIIENEGEQFLACLRNKIFSLPTWDQKIQAYILERQHYFQRNVNLHSLSIKTADQLRFHPIFRELAARFSDREADLIKEILDQAYRDSQIKKVNTKKTASIILSVANSLKNENMDFPADLGTPDLINYTTIEEDTRFAVELILDGLKTGS